MGTYRIPAASLVSGWSLTPAQQLQNATLIQNALDHAIVPPPADAYKAVVIPIGIWDIGTNTITVPDGMSLYGEGPDEDFIKRLLYPPPPFEARGTILVYSGTMNAIYIHWVKNTELGSMSIWAPNIPAASEASLDSQNLYTPGNPDPYAVQDYPSAVRLSGGWSVKFNELEFETWNLSTGTRTSSAAIYCDTGRYPYAGGFEDFGLYQLDFSNIHASNGYICIIGKDDPVCMANNMTFSDLWIRSLYSRRVGVISLDTVYSEGYGSSEYGFYFKHMYMVTMTACTCDTGTSSNGIKFDDVKSFNGAGVGLGALQVSGAPQNGFLSTEHGDQRSWNQGSEQSLLKRTMYDQSANTKLEIGDAWDTSTGNCSSDTGYPYKYRFLVSRPVGGNARQMLTVSGVENQFSGQGDPEFTHLKLDKNLVHIIAGAGSETNSKIILDAPTSVDIIGNTDVDGALTVGHAALIREDLTAERNVSVGSSLIFANPITSTSAATGSYTIQSRVAGYLQLKIVVGGATQSIKIPYYL